MNSLAPNPNYMLLFPLASSLLIFISTAIFFIKWQNNWIKIHADAELENKKFETDMLRASWLAEMYFEWDEKKEMEFPPQMVESFTKNLFEHVSGNVSVSHPYEDIIKNLKNVSKFKIGKDCIQIEQNHQASENKADKEQ